MRKRLFSRSTLAGQAAAVAVVLAGCATPAQVSPFAGTYRASSGGETLHLRIAAHGRVDVFSPADGRQASGQAVIGLVGGRPGFVGVLSSGEVLSVGHDGAAPSVAIGSSLYTLQPLPAARFGQLDAPAPAAAAKIGATAAGSASGSLGGLRLAMAKGGNGYFYERSFDFCSDGRVFTSFAESQMSQLGSAVGERVDQGSWQLRGASLHLNLARSGAQSFTVHRLEPRVVRLDGRSYLVEPNSRCR